VVIKECLNCNKEFNVQPSQIKRGGGKYCSLSCCRTHKNLIDNPVNKQGVKEKISKNHANVAGKNNPMYGKTNKLAPNYKDGRSKFNGRVGRKVCLANKIMFCELCGEDDINKLEAHHKDKDRKNNNLTNLSVLCRYCHRNIVHQTIRDNKTGRFIKQITDNSKLK
jgi:hypothetical protein